MKEKRYTYKDYCTWNDSKRYELIDGIAYVMAAPTLRHQEICGRMCNRISSYLEGKHCKVFASPIDVRLNFHKEDDTVVQPDIIVVCDFDKLSDGKAVKGAPDFIIEILSPATSKKDRVFKRRKYEQAGVKEF